MAPKGKQVNTRQNAASNAKDVGADHPQSPPTKKRKLRGSTVAPVAKPQNVTRARSVAPRSTRNTVVSGTPKNTRETRRSALSTPTLPKKQEAYAQDIWREQTPGYALCTVCNCRIKRGPGDFGLSKHAITPKHQTNLLKMDSSATQTTVTIDDPPITQTVRKPSPPPPFTAPITPASTPGPAKETEDPTRTPSLAKNHVIHHINEVRALWEFHYAIPIGLNQLRISTTMARHTPLLPFIMGTPCDSTLSIALRTKVEALGKVSKEVGSGLNDLLEAELVEMRRVQELQEDATRHQDRCNMLNEARRGANELSELFNQMAYDVQVHEGDTKLLNRVDQKLMEGTTKVEKLAEVMKGILSEALAALSHV